jgi:NADH:ubiquinone oxidoreductase subunit C
VDRSLATRLQAHVGSALRGPVRQKGDQTEIRVAPADLLGVLKTLHDAIDMRFEVLADLAGVDTGDTLQVVIHLWGERSPDWLRIIVEGLPRQDPRCPSVTSMWPGAEWLEREAYDMFGIVFEGNRDLRRIFMPPEYASFPLRKDFYLPDDSSRSPGLGVRPVEQPHPPAVVQPDPAAAVRRSPAS